MHAGLPFHPLSNIYRLMKGAEYDALVEDIRQRGLLNPITLYQGQVLDGRNRQRACLDAGQPLSTVTYEGDDPLGHMLALNHHRRQDTESQRAMTAARLATLPHGVRSDRQDAPIGASTQDEAADLLNVGRRSVQRAREVLKGTELEIIDAVDGGEMAVSAAAGLVGKTREQQLARLARDRNKAAGTHRQKDDWYRTPPECTRALLKVERFPRVIWEPACGDGAIAKVLAAAGYRVISTDLVDRGYGEGGVDFLAETEMRGEAIITNPPYDIADEFARHALKLGAKVVALLCRLAWLEGSDRYVTLFRHGKLAQVWVFSPRQTLWRGDETGEGDGGMTAYAWFVFDADHEGPTALGWLGPEELS